MNSGTLRALRCQMNVLPETLRNGLCFDKIQTPQPAASPGLNSSSRTDVLSGDLRLFYLLWLTAVEDELVFDSEVEPLPGIDPLTRGVPPRRHRN